jgi:hypothetical protein
MVPNRGVGGKKSRTEHAAPTVNHVNDEKTANAKNGHVPILRLRLSEIIPSPLNEKIYRPVSPDDPEIRDLAESIRKEGLQEALVIARDRVLISGHRRRVACGLAGLNEVLCRVEPIDSSDPEFVGRRSTQ